MPPLTPERLRKVRLKLGKSQDEFGALLNRSRITINRWERGRQPIPDWLSHVLLQWRAPGPIGSGTEV